MYVLQINCNHSRQSQDLIIQYMYENKIAVCVLMEPYKAEGTGMWIKLTSGTVAVLIIPLIQKSDIKILKIGFNYIFVKINNFVLGGYYVSPNIDNNNYERLLFDFEIETRKYLKDYLIICGD